jgi:hypothetical protein
MGLVDPFDVGCVIVVLSHFPAGYGKVGTAGRIPGNPVGPACTPAFLRAVVSETFHVCAPGQQYGESKKRKQAVCLHACSSGIFEVKKVISGIGFMYLLSGYGGMNFSENSYLGKAHSLPTLRADRQMSFRRAQSMLSGKGGASTWKRKD